MVKGGKPDLCWWKARLVGKRPILRVLGGTPPMGGGCSALIARLGRGKMGCRQRGRAFGRAGGGGCVEPLGPAHYSSPKAQRRILGNFIGFK